MPKDERHARSKKSKSPEPKPRRIVVYLPPPIAKRLFHQCAEHDLSISEVGVEAIKSWLVTHD